MMLRSRSAANAAAQNNKNAAAKPTDDVKRAAKKASDTENADGEPSLKRQRVALANISQTFSSIQIDSSKRTSQASSNASSSSEASRALPSVQEDMEIDVETLPDVVDPTEAEAEVHVDVEGPVEALADPLALPEVKPEAEFDPCPEYDFDAGCAGDEYAVAPFANDIFKYYRSREMVFKVDDYMPRQKHFSPANRSILVDWMVSVQERFELNHETLYLGVKLVDTYLSKQDNVELDHLQMIACASIFIACKFDERTPPVMDDFLYVADDKFQREDLIRMEMRVLKVVGFDLGSPLSYRYVRRYARVASADMETLTLARFITETALMFYELAGVAESRIAAAAFLLAMKMLNAENTWNPILHKYSGYREEEVEPLMWELNHMLYVRRQGTYNRLTTVFAKYSHEVFYRSATLPLLPNMFSAKRRVQAPAGQGFDRQL